MSRNKNAMPVASDINFEQKVFYKKNHHFYGEHDDFEGCKMSKVCKSAQGTCGFLRVMWGLQDFPSPSTLHRASHYPSSHEDEQDHISMVI